MTPLAEARALVVARGKCTVLHGVDLTVGLGEAVAIVGPNAAGKTTLLQSLAGLLPSAEGAVLLKGKPVGDWKRDALARVVALVGAEEGTPSPLTVEDRVRLGRYPHRGPFRPLTSEDGAAVERAIRLARVESLAHRRLDTLSAGERQLAALARGLAQEPELLLLDEPAAHLDVRHQLHVFRILQDVRARGVAIVAIVHDLQRAADWADRMILVASGRIAAEGRPSEVLSSKACSEALRVAIRSHAFPGRAEPLYSFEEVL